MSSKTLRNLGGLILVLLVVAVWAWMTHDSDGSGPDGDANAGTILSPSVAASKSGSSTGSSTDPDSGLPWIGVSALPPQAREVLTEIDHGGPFAYAGKDGSTFGNFEGVLPRESRGYYHEYTVPTPGASTRGTRRIITGAGGEFYWTADHYQHFSRIRR